MDEVRLLIENIVDGICDSRDREAQKKETIDHVMSWLRKNWPIWLENRAAALLGAYVMRLLQSSLTGSEEIEEADKMAENLMDEIFISAHGYDRPRQDEGH